jgi:hypothetical protein
MPGRAVRDSLDREIEDDWYEGEDAPRAVYSLPTRDHSRLSSEQQIANAEYIFDYLTAHGWSKEAICALLGNIQLESWLNPGAWEVGGTGYGLVQWTPAAKFLNWAGIENAAAADELARNNPRGLMDLQLEFLIWSSLPTTHSDYREWWPHMVRTHYNRSPLRHNTPGRMSFEEYISSMYDVEDLTLVFHATYVRSGDNAAVLQERIDFANQWYDYFTNR